MQRQQAGALDRRVTIQIRGEVRNEFGELVDGYTTFAERWARVVPAAGQETFKIDELRARQNKLFEIRFLEGVKPDMRVVHDGNTYNVEDVAEGASRRDLLLLNCYALQVSPGA